MTQEEFSRTAAELDNAFNSFFGVPGMGTRTSQSARLTDGKLFELRALTWLLDNILAANPQIAPRPSHPGLGYFVLRVVPSNLDYNEPHIILSAHGQDIARVWLNVQVASRGAARRRRSGSYVETPPDYHELDIALTAPNVPDRKSIDPRHLRVGVECKDRRLQKSMVREILGLRRLVSLLTGPEDQHEGFPVLHLPPALQQYPPSHLVLCSSRHLGALDPLEEEHGITLVHIPL